MKCFLRKSLATFLILCLALSFFSCSDTKNKFPVINESLYDAADSLVFCRERVFRNMPGMVLYTNHNRLSFMNKETEKSYLYCFDPLCDHGDNCITNTNPYTLYYYWSMIDDCLYATMFNLETAGNDGNFYRIDPNTQEMERVFQGNGNEFFTIYVNEQYFFFERALKDGGESEPMIDFSGSHTGQEYDMYAYAAACYDGVIYCNLRSDNSSESVDVFGIITQGDDGVWVYRSVEAGD